MLNADLYTRQGKRLQSNTLRAQSSSMTSSQAPFAESTEVLRGHRVYDLINTLKATDLRSV